MGTEVSCAQPISAPTSARYLDLMLEGARDVGMEENVIAVFESTPAVPRRGRAELRRVPHNADVSSQLFTEADLRANWETFAVFRGRVLRKPESGESMFPRRPIGKDEPLDSCFQTARHFYDPLHGCPPDDPFTPWS